MWIKRGRAMSIPFIFSIASSTYVVRKYQRLKGGPGALSQRKPLCTHLNAIHTIHHVTQRRGSLAQVRWRTQSQFRLVSEALATQFFRSWKTLAARRGQRRRRRISDWPARTPPCNKHSLREWGGEWYYFFRKRHLFTSFPVS